MVSSSHAPSPYPSPLILLGLKPLQVSMFAYYRAKFGEVSAAKQKSTVPEEDSDLDDWREDSEEESEDEKDKIEDLEEAKMGRQGRVAIEDTRLAKNYIESSPNLIELVKLITRDDIVSMGMNVFISTYGPK